MPAKKTEKPTESTKTAATPAKKPVEKAPKLTEEEKAEQALIEKHADAIEGLAQPVLVIEARARVSIGAHKTVKGMSEVEMKAALRRLVERKAAGRGLAVLGAVVVDKDNDRSCITASARCVFADETDAA